MESLYFLIPLSLLFIGAAVAVFAWAVKSGQYDDLEREGERILFDDDGIAQENQKTGTSLSEKTVLKKKTLKKTTSKPAPSNKAPSNTTPAKQASTNQLSSIKASADNPSAEKDSDSD